MLAKAQAGDATAQEEVGEAYCDGRLVPQDYAQGLDWLKKAAAQGNSHAASRLGALYKFGMGDAPPNQFEAFNWYLTAAAGGGVADELEVADRYFKGKGVTQSYVQGLDWYIKAARQGSLKAQVELGIAYLNGLGATKDPEKAFTYFLRAAGQGNGMAQYYVASFFWNGTFVERDPIQAYKWCKVSITHYNSQEATDLWHTITSSLTAEQKAQGEVLVANWPREMEGNAARPLQATFTSGTSTKVPFELVNGNIAVHVTVNGNKELKFMLDTGAADSIIDGICTSALKLPRSSFYEAAGGIGKNTFLSNQTAPLQLGLPGLTFDQVSLAISPAMPGTDGFLGLDLVKNYVLKIDYVNKTLEFISPQSFNAADAGQPIPLTITHLKALVSVRIKNNDFESPAANFVLDTGCAGGIVLSQHFLLANTSLAFTRGRTGQAFGFGGNIREEMVACSSASLGDLTLQNPMVSLVAQDQGAFQRFNGLIGNKVWQYFDVTLDFPNGRLYLKPNSKYQELAPPPPKPLAAPAGPD